MTAVWPTHDQGPADVAGLRSRLAAGAEPGDLRRLPGRVQRAVAVAQAVGAPGLPALEAVASALDDAERRRRALRVATAQARAVAGGLLALPLVLVPGLARLLGLDLVGFYTSPPGAAVLAIAAVLVATGVVAVTLSLRRATGSGGRPRGEGRGVRPGRAIAVGLLCGLVAGPPVGLAVASGLLVLDRRRPRPPPLADEVADLVATALAGGVAAPEALRVVADHLPAHARGLRRLALGLDLGAPAGTAPPPLVPLAEALATSLAWGAPAVPSLRALARDLRAEALADALAAAERLPAQLTFPTALCLLPASVLLVGAPLVADGLATAAGVR